MAATVSITLHTKKKLGDIFEKQNLAYDKTNGSFYHKMTSPLIDGDDDGRETDTGTVTLDA